MSSIHILARLAHAVIASKLLELPLCGVILLLRQVDRCPLMLLLVDHRLLLQLLVGLIHQLLLLLLLLETFHHVLVEP